MAKKKVKERTHLSEVEMMKYELHHEKEKTRKKELEEFDLKRKIAEYKMAALQKEIQLLVKDKEVMTLKQNVDRQQHIKFHKQLEEEFGPGFGYNPETGEVMRKE